MNDEPASFHKSVPPIGDFRLRPLRIPEDIPLIHDWVNREYAKYWGMLGHSVEAVESAYLEIARQAQVFLGFCDAKPAFLLECYQPIHDPVGEHYAAQPGDRGMHILVAPADRPIANFTWSVFTVIMDFLFSDARVKRIVVEPDVRNNKIHALNKRAGFEYQKIIILPNKTAYLAFCTKDQYHAALQKENHAMNASTGLLPEHAVAHLQPHTWATVNALHIRKAISELAHELLIQPELQSVEGDWGHYVLATDAPNTEYRFRGRLLSLEHWHIDKDSLEKRVDGNKVPLDSLSFILEFSERLGIDPAMLPAYLEEIASTLYGGAYKQARAGLSAAELTRADFQAVETAMTEGHPSFIANNGRIGFDAIDYQAYAPEAASPVKLIWLAAHKDKAAFGCVDDLSYAELLHQELGAAQLEKFTRTLQRQGLDPQAYLLMPVHPW